VSLLSRVKRRVREAGYMVDDAVERYDMGRKAKEAEVTCEECGHLRFSVKERADGRRLCGKCWREVNESG